MTVIEILDAAREWVGMSRSEFTSTTGACFGFIGGVLLAFAASKELQAHRLAISALQLETIALVQAFQNNGTPLVRVTGTDKHILSGQRWNTGLTRLGIICLSFSVALTILAFFVPNPTPPKPDTAEGAASSVSPRTAQ